MEEFPTPRGLSAETVTHPSPDARELLATVLEALDIPTAASEANGKIRSAILAERLLYTVVALRSLAEGTFADTAAPVTECMGWLHTHLAEHPATGYVTYEQAQKRMRAGASWSDAVSLDYDGEAGK